MSNLAKLKKKAAEFEAKKNYEKALELYEQVLASNRAGEEEHDVPLHNRVGDIHYRIGNNEQAISYYEQAADLYAEDGLFNNAIALCNKILRYSPGRTIIYYKLGIISAKKGFNSDAKQNFLEYADRMQKMGKMDEAFRALKEFADLCPGQDDVRLMLAEQLARAERKAEALEQLQLLYHTLESEGRSSEAAAAVDRMKAIDPTFMPQRSTGPRERKKEGLIFLDLEFEGPGDVEKIRDSRSSGARTLPEAPEGFVERDSAPPEGLELTSLADEEAPASPSAKAPANGAGPGDTRGELRFLTPDSAAQPTWPSGSHPPLELLPDVDEPGDPALERIPDLIDFPVGSTPSRGLSMLADSADAGPLAGLDVLVDISSASSGTGVDVDDPEVPEDRDDPAPVAMDLTVEPDIGPELVIHEASAEEEEPQRPDEEFIDLGEWLQQNRTPASTRMVAHDEEPDDDEQKDFGEMLDKFKAGISQNVDEEDYVSHYDLGIAFREMGLLDEAIGSFQKASRGTSQHVRASEAIGQCFMDKGEAAVAMTVLSRILKEPNMNDSRLVGVIYLLGRAAESLGRSEDAEGYYQRVLAVQIGFRDTGERLTSLAQASR
ncbi:MAG: tetratricopeptide repeat protein [Gemmatimonadaceae bacterium]|nr:tetratricopeptide repeat protein [Gemmatimonadaceae bacterium]